MEDIFLDRCVKGEYLSSVPGRPGGLFVSKGKINASGVCAILLLPGYHSGTRAFCVAPAIT